MGQQKAPYPAVVFVTLDFADSQTLVSGLWGQRCDSEKECNMGIK